MPNLSEARAIALQHIEEHKFLPDYIKPLAKSMVTRHFQVLSNDLGSLELAIGRTEHAIRNKRNKSRRKKSGK